MKKLFALVLIIGLGIFVSMGCVTKGLWKGSEVKTYTDSILSFYSNPQKNEIIFIGKKYHYIFNEGTVALQEVLKAKDFLGLNKENLQIHTYTQKQDASIIHTGVGINFKTTRISTQQGNWLVEHGFRKIARDVPILRNSFDLKGKRYKANSQVNAKALKLREPIDIQVDVRSNNTLYKVLMTPVTVTADAGLALAGAIILPILWIVN